MICKKRIIKLFSSVFMLCGFIFGLTSCSLDKNNEKVEPTVTADGIDYCDGDEIDMPENVVFRYDGSDRASSLTLKATIAPDTAINKDLNWSLVWADGGSHGKTTYYVTLTPSSDTLSCTVMCIQGFNYQLKVVVSSSKNSNVNASCTLDYEKRAKYIDYDDYYVFNECEETAGKLNYGGVDDDGTENFYVNLNDGAFDINYCCPVEEIELFSTDNITYVGTVKSKESKKYVYGEYEWIYYQEGLDDYWPLRERFQCVSSLYLSDIFDCTGIRTEYNRESEDYLFASVYDGLLKVILTVEDEYGSIFTINIFYYYE